MKNKLIFLQIFIAIALICTSVYAAIETTIGITVSNSTLDRGDTVEVTLSLRDVDSSKKVTSVSGYVNYDKKVIETINYDCIVKNEDNTVKIGDEVLPVEDLTNATLGNMTTTSAYVGFNGSPTSDNDSKIVIDFNDGLTKDTELLTMKFKVKSDATIGEVKNAISYSMFVITAGSEQSEEITQNVNLTVKEVVNNDDKDDEDKDQDKNEAKNESKNENKNEDKNQNKNENKNNNTNTNKANNAVGNTNTTDNTVSGMKLPATGAKVIVIPAIILVAIAYICYNKYVRMKGI